MHTVTGSRKLHNVRHRLGAQVHGLRANQPKCTALATPRGGSQAPWELDPLATGRCQLLSFSMLLEVDNQSAKHSDIAFWEWPGE